jgi:hypothetical protein
MAPTTPPSIYTSIRILRMDTGDGSAAGAVAVATSAGRKQGKKAPGGLETPKVLNNFGRQNTPRAAKSDGGVHEPELAGRTRSPHKKARGEEDSSLDRLDREKVFNAAKKRHGIEADASAKDDVNAAEAKDVVEDDSDDDGASGGGPHCETRAAKGSRSAVATTGRPKAGQDPDDPADRAGNGPRSTKASPKSACGVPAHAALGGRGVPARAAVGGQGVSDKIVNGSSGDDASFASKEEDDEHDPDDKIAVKARFALGFWPSD